MDTVKPQTGEDPALVELVGLGRRQSKQIITLIIISSQLLIVAMKAKNPELRETNVRVLI